MTETGKVREVNEDSVMTNNEQAHWAVADGMGGHLAGDIASQMITNNLAPLSHKENLADFLEDIEDTLLGVNQNLFSLAQSRNSVIGSTIVGAVIHQGFIVIYWAGDSRAYVLRNNTLRQITEDHTVVHEMLQNGQISAAEAKSHPDRNVITRAVGSHPKLFVDFHMQQIDENDLYLICSDGIEKEIADEELELILRPKTDIEETGKALLNETLRRGARDNVSFILIKPVSISNIT
ncbi:PP2C family protein-serine/threonine phosphatase [Alteromonas sp. ASW11-130]|uniref:PP2C family protein-serine/threonine phosphatase n=1 Tax=Alteromonas sp. ASW11-130 TaxID=3015775 RepID=UPI002242B821|nr:protein phosphatase 2C domain-containing protein [Alteromonas sp. ASW11-130]MCW8090307.1 protein phosphatase 2C domain-containing protein [Alteromonas sp. ASW11-130]